MKLLFDESLSPRLVDLLHDLFPESERALRNGLARTGDVRIFEYAVRGGIVLVSTDSDFRTLMQGFPTVRVVILQACDYPTAIAADVMRKNAIRIAQLFQTEEHLLVLER